MSTAAVAARAVGPVGTSTQLAGLGGMVRLVLRRNRWFLVFWVLGLVSLLPATLKKYDEVLPPASRSGAALEALGANPTMRAIVGHAFDLSTAGGFAMWRVGTFVAAAAALMTSLLVIRATRAEEEAGRQEVLRSGAVGRHAPLAAALVVAIGAMALVALLTTVGMAKSGAPWAGSLAAGLGIGLTGTMFAGAAAVCAQLFESARTARYWAVGGLLGGLYLARAVVDTQGDGREAPAAMWAMPLDWAALVRPYAGERWWVLLLPLVTTVATIAVAFALEARRDYGAGLRRPRPGAAHAPASLGGAFGLAWRLQRGGVLGWLVGILAFTLGTGGIASQLQDFLRDNTALAEMFRKMGGGADKIVDAFYTAMLGIVATLVALAGVLVLSRLLAEERSGHAEAVLATSQSRTKLALSHLLPALGLVVLAGTLIGTLLPVTSLGEGADAGTVGELTRAALALLPGSLAVVGLGMFLAGWAPRLFGLTWGVLGWSMFVSWLLPAVWLDAPQWVSRLTPWGWLPHLPAEPMRWVGWTVTLAIALALTVLGIVGYRRRDLPAA